MCLSHIDKDFIAVIFIDNQKQLKFPLIRKLLNKLEHINAILVYVLLEAQLVTKN